MVFGFGFNKAKVLASAERNVKQGKLNNAIADYEKISKEDPKDLHILNTLGDLHARLGNLERASACFKRVGDTYASEGFTVKAIAMYKKLTKHHPNASDAILKLADLYTQQGLYSDARVQYTTAAEQFLANNEPDAAAAVLQKVLDFDPNNPQIQARLADLYVRLGKKTEARDIYFRSAQSLRSRGALQASDDALQHVLELEPGFAQAALLRGQLKLDCDDPQGAVDCLAALPDIDSRPEGLRLMLRGYLKLGHRPEAELLAQKLLKVHSDPSGIPACAELLIKAGEYDEVLRLYREHADRLLAADSAAMLKTLNSLVGRVKSSPRSLESISELLQRAGNTTQLAEVTELLAHAYVQEGELSKARDLYHKLAELEPENPLHLQNYRQILGRLGEDSEASPETADENSEAFLVDELEQVSPVLEQNNPSTVRNAIREALTDSELFASYNLPTRAILPLEAVLPQVPDNVEINQRLTSLYVRLGRLADAASCCAVLHKAYAKAGRLKESEQYAEMAAKYRGRAGLPPDTNDLELHGPSDGGGTAALEPASPAEGNSPPVMQSAANEEVSPPAAAPPVAEPEAASTVAASAADSSTPQATQQEFAGEPAAKPSAHEIDLSEEWDRVVTADQAPASDSAAGEAAVLLWEIRPEAVESEPDGEVVAETSPAGNRMDPALSDIIEEVQFYLAQQMWEEARGAFARAESLAADAPAVIELRSRIASAPSTNAEDVRIEDESSSPDLHDDVDARDTPSLTPVPEPAVTASAPEFALQPAAPEAAHLGVSDAPGDPTPQAPETEPEVQSDSGTAYELPAPAAQIPQLPAEPVPQGTNEWVALDNSAESPAALPTASPAMDKAPEAGAGVSSEPASVQAAQNADDLLGDLVLELDESFVGLTPDLPATNGNPLAPDPAVVNLGAESTESILPPEQAPPAETVSAIPPAWQSSGTAPGSATEPFTSALSDLFDEFKQDVEAEGQESADPETHYNLGVAFKEMGLLDEAIGELQKVCQTVEHGTAFPQTVQAYTWLAHCFVEKGIPEAGVRWYEKALRIPSLSTEQTTAIQYELGCAQQATGNLNAAREHFLHVLSVNIDYRDIADRIKALKP